MPSWKACLSDAMSAMWGQQAQFDLGIVRRHQEMARFPDKGAADATPFLGADRNVLKIGIRGGETSGGGSRHGKRCVDPLRGGIDLLYKRIGVGALEFRQLAPLQHAGGQIVTLGGKALENVGARGTLPAIGQAHFVKQDLAELFRRTNAERPSGKGVDPGFQVPDAVAEFARETFQLLPVHLDSGTLHGGEDGNQRPFDGLVDPRDTFRNEAWPEPMPQAQRHFGVLRRIVAGPVKWNQIEGHLGLAPAGDLLEGDHLAAEML